jgi:hypothetical protein
MKIITFSPFCIFTVGSIVPPNNMKSTKSTKRKTERGEREKERERENKGVRTFKALGKRIRCKAHCGFRKADFYLVYSK